MKRDILTTCVYSARMVLLNFHLNPTKKKSLKVIFISHLETFASFSDSFVYFADEMTFMEDNVDTNTSTFND